MRPVLARVRSWGILGLLCWLVSGWGVLLHAELKPEEVAVIATAGSKGSLEIARYYMQARKLPEENLFLLKKAYPHTTPREVWNNEIRPEIREWLLAHPRIRCVVCCWNVPLRIEAYPEKSPHVVERLAYLKQWRQDTFQRVQDLAEKLYSFFPAEGDGEAKGDDETALKAPQLDAKFSAGRLAKLFEKALQDVRQANLNQPPEVQDRFFRRMPLFLQALSGAKAVQNMLNHQMISPVHDNDQKARVQLRQQILECESKLAALEIQRETRDRDLAIVSLTVQNSGLLGLLTWLDTQIRLTKKNESTASFDSELSLIFLEDHAIFQWMPNFLSVHAAQFTPHLKLLGESDKTTEKTPAPSEVELPGLEEATAPSTAGESTPSAPSEPAAVVSRGPQTLRPMLMVARLEAPSVEIVKRMIDDAIAIEQTGLEGAVCLDARWSRKKKATAFGSYEQTDQQLYQLADRLKQHTKLTLKLETTEKLLQRADCPAPVALYCGWYALAHYVDAFEFSRGAVAWHIASMEAVYLKKGKFWCPNLLSHGCAATLGATFEPYLSAFPNPDEFYSLLLTGKYPLVECFYRTMPFSSWALTLVGDPLYTPYRKNPQLTDKQLPVTLAR